MDTDKDIFRYALASIANAANRDDLHLLIFELRDLYGFAHLVYHSALSAPPADREPLHLLTYDPGWIKRYVAEGYSEVDPVEAAFRSSALPINWAMLDRKAGRSAAFFEDAAKYDVGRNGLSLPVFSVTGGRALLSFTSNAENDRWDEFYRSRMGDLGVIGQYLHHRMVALDGGRWAEQSLTPREQQCLEALSTGLACKQIADRVGISETTVRDHLRSVTRKLDCRNIKEIIPKAIALGLVDLGNLKFK